MKNKKIRERIINYVRECQCPSGGYCFYGIDEPNGSDTYFALSILKYLHALFNDDKTVSFLQNMQHNDGSYESIFAAFYALNGLSILKKLPLFNYSSYLIKNIDQYKFDASQLPAEIILAFQKTFYLISLFKFLKKRPNSAVRPEMIHFLLQFKNNDRGFGVIRSSLRETALALAILKELEYPVAQLNCTAFIRICETPLYGFTDIPGTSLSFIEHIHAGLLASSILNYKPLFTKQCIDFIINCQTRTGGFSRTTHGGIATLENTFLAIESLFILQHLCAVNSTNLRRTL